MPPALAALTLSPEERTAAASEVSQRLVLRGILPPDVPTRGVPGQVLAGIQRGAFGVGTTFGDALGLAFPETGKGVREFFQGFQMQSSGGMIEQAAETATQSLGVLATSALALTTGGVPAAVGVGLPALTAIATPAVFGMAQATQTREFLQAANDAVVQQGGKPLSGAEIATAMAATGATEFGTEFISNLLFLKRFFPGSTAMTSATQALRRYFADPSLNRSLRMVARATEESVRAGLREAPEEFVAGAVEAGVVRGALGPERRAMAERAGVLGPAAPLEEGFQAAKIALLAGPFFAAGGAAGSRMLRGRPPAEAQQAPPQGQPAGDVSEAARPAVMPALAPIVAPPTAAPGVAQTVSPGAVPATGIPGAPRRQEVTQAINPLTGEGIAPSVPPTPPPVGAGVVVNPLTGEQVPVSPEDVARFAGTPLLGVRPRREQAPEGAPVGPPPPVEAVAPPAAAAPPLPEAQQAMLPDLVSALRNLGYTQRDATAAAQAALAQQPASLEEAIPLALRPFQPRPASRAPTAAPAPPAPQLSILESQVATDALSLVKSYGLMNGLAVEALQRKYPNIDVSLLQDAASKAQSILLKQMAVAAGIPAAAPSAPPVPEVPTPPPKAVVDSGGTLVYRGFTMEPMGPPDPFGNRAYRVIDTQGLEGTQGAVIGGAITSRASAQRLIDREANALGLPPQPEGAPVPVSRPSQEAPQLAQPSQAPQGQERPVPPEQGPQGQETTTAATQPLPRPAPPGIQQPVTGQQTLVDTSQLTEQERATQAQITREGVEAEAGTRLRPTVEQAPPTGLFEQEQALPFQEAPSTSAQQPPAVVPPQAPALPREAPALGRALTDTYAGPLQRMTEQGLTTAQMHTVLTNELRERHGETGLQDTLRVLEARGFTGDDALVRFIDNAIDQAFGLTSEAEMQQQALREANEGPDILAVIRQADAAGRFGIKVTKATETEQEFRDLVGIVEGGRRNVARLMNNTSGLTPQEMANHLADLGYLPEASETELLNHLRERLGTGRHMGPRYQPGGLAEPLAFLSRLMRRPTPGGDRADATPTTKRQVAAVLSRLNYVADGETVIATTMQAEPGRRVAIPGVLRPGGAIEVVRTIPPSPMIQAMRTTGAVAFTGQTIRTGEAGSRDMAVLGQLVRDPEVEHLHYVLGFPDRTARRVVEIGSRLPSSTAAFVKVPGQRLTPGFRDKGMQDLRTVIRKTGATWVRVLHNHPSGNPVPSEADKAFTRHLAAAIPEFEGHVVIDSGRYAEIDREGNVTLADLDTGRPDPFLQPSLGLPFAEVQIRDGGDAAAVGRMLANPGFVTLVLLNKRPTGTALGVRGVLLVPEAALTQPHDQIKAYMESLESEFGAVLATAYYDGTSPAVHTAAEMLYRDGVLTDYVMAMPQGGEVSLAEEQPELAPDRRFVRARRLEAAAGERVEEPIEDLRRETERRVQEAGGEVNPPLSQLLKQADDIATPDNLQSPAGLEQFVTTMRRAVYAHYATANGTFASIPEDMKRLISEARIQLSSQQSTQSGIEELYTLVVRGAKGLDMVPWLMHASPLGPEFNRFPPGFSASGRMMTQPGLGGVAEEAPSLPTRQSATLDIPNVIQGVTVAQAGKLATAYRMMFDVGHSLHSSHIQRPLSQVTFQKLRIRWEQMEDIGQQMMLRFMQHPEELDAIRRRIQRDPTAGLSTAENAGLVQWSMVMMDDLDVKRSLGEIDQATFDQEWDAIIKNALLLPAAASSAGRTLALQRRFQQVGSYTITDFLRREERARGRALTDEEKRQKVGDFFDVLRTGDRDLIRDAMEKQTDPTLLDYYWEAYYGSLLSGLPTLNVNTFGTLAHITFQKFVVGPTAVGLDWMISGFSGQERQRYMREVFADFNATWKNAGQRYREAWYWWKSPFPQGIGGEGQLAQPAGALRQGFALTRGGMRLDAGSGADAWMRAPTQHPDGTPNRWGQVMRRLAPFVGAASRVMAATDAVATNLAFQGEVAKLATREGIRRFGIQDRQQVDNFVTHVQTHLVQYPAIEDAAKAAARADTFNDPAGSLARALLGARRAPQPFGFFFRLLVPFANTPDRLLARGAELVPGLGLVVGYREAGLTYTGWLADFRKGDPKAVEVAAKQVVGLMLASMAAVLWDKDLLTGPLPTEPQERQAWERQGKLPFAIRMGDNWVEYRRVEPFISAPFGALTAGLQAIKTMRENRLKQGLALDYSYMDDASSVAAGIAFNMSKFILDSSYFSGLASFFESTSRTSQGFATGLTQQLVSATLPLSGLLRNLNRTIEASGMLGTEPGVVLMRQRERVGEQYLRSIPGFASQVRPRLDVFGQPVVSERPLLGAVGGLLSPIRRQVAQDDPVEATFERLQFRPGRPPRRQLETVVGRRIEDEEYDAYAERRGTLARETIERIVGLPFFEALPQDKQLARLKQAFSQATRRARREVFGRAETTQERRTRFADAALAAAGGE